MTQWLIKSLNRHASSLIRKETFKQIQYKRSSLTCTHFTHTHVLLHTSVHTYTHGTCITTLSARRPNSRKGWFWCSGLVQNMGLRPVGALGGLKTCTANREGMTPENLIGIRPDSDLVLKLSKNRKLTHKMMLRVEGSEILPQIDLKGVKIGWVCVRVSTEISSENWKHKQIACTEN